MDWECCWAKKEIAADECDLIGQGEEELLISHRRRIVEKCLDCSRFRNDLLRMKELDTPLAEVIPHIVAEFHDQKNQLTAMIGFLDSKIRQIKFLHELSTVLQTSMDLDEVLSVAMTAITAGKGFGMNRAFLLMVDKDRNNLLGYLGVGPRSFDEAWQTWDDLNKSNFSLKELARHFQKNKLSSEKVKFQHILEQLKVPLNSQHLFNRVLRDRKPYLVENSFDHPEVDPSLAALLDVDCFLVMPLISRNRRIGVILADNCITHKPITPHDMQSLETFAFPVAFALERASLYERLQEEVVKQVEANQKLREQQELIVKMEQMALVGKITSSVAHSIRNPLTVIGGFARSLLKNTEESDWKKEYLETIVRETRQLEEVLAEILDYSESLHPVLDKWDVNQLVSAVLEEFRSRMEQEGITCLKELSRDIPMMLIDYRQIAYCVRTIVATAMDGAEHQGKINVATTVQGEDLVISISDNGATLGDDGVETLASQVFETPDPGHGVGLQLCRGILERHGSSLVIKSGPGSGTLYLIRLPIGKGGEDHGQVVVG